MNRQNYQGKTILAKDIYMNTDSWKTGLNNNLLCVGPSGSGKTRSVLIPNLLQMDCSYVVIDTKGQLFSLLGPYLNRNGYTVHLIDFTDISHSTIGYDPLDYIRVKHAGYVEQDIISIAHMLCPNENRNEPFWDIAAANYIASYIAYVLETQPLEEQNLAAVINLFETIYNGQFNKRLYTHIQNSPDAFSSKLYKRACNTQRASHMHASILGVIAEKLMPFGFTDAMELYRMQDRIDFGSLGTQNTALFISLSDTDHSLSKLVNLFIFQLFQALMQIADKQPNGVLNIPVRIFLDDFSNLWIPDFADTLSVVRSREIYVTILCQTVTQLMQRYGQYEAEAIMGNCDTHLVLGFQDNSTAEYYAPRIDKPMHRLLECPLDKSYLFVRGQRPQLVHRYDLNDSSAYIDMLKEEAIAEAEFMLR